MRSPKRLRLVNLIWIYQQLSWERDFCVCVPTHITTGEACRAWVLVVVIIEALTATPEEGNGSILDSCLLPPTKFYWEGSRFLRPNRFAERHTYFVFIFFSRQLKCHSETKAVASTAPKPVVQDKLPSKSKIYNKIFLIYAWNIF